jgi:hypothetical protein
VTGSPFTLTVGYVKIRERKFNIKQFMFNLKQFSPEGA